MRILIFFGILLAIIAYSTPSAVTASDQKPEQTQKDIYVPKDLDDCFVELKRLLKPEDIQKMKNGTEDDMIRYHLGLGMWLRNNWGLWQGSRLKKYFNELGIYHPDDMSGIILDSFWRHLNNRPIKLQKQIKFYQKIWKNAENEYKKRGLDFMNKGQYDLAIWEFNIAVEINPNNEVYYINRGRAYYFKGEYDKSWEDFKKAQDLGYKVPPEFLDQLRKASGRQN